jgi:hypothetical protein
MYKVVFTVCVLVLFLSAFAEDAAPLLTDAEVRNPRLRLSHKFKSIHPFLPKIAARHECQRSKEVPGCSKPAGLFYFIVTLCLLLPLHSPHSFTLLSTFIFYCLASVCCCCTLVTHSRSCRLFQCHGCAEKPDFVKMAIENKAAPLFTVRKKLNDAANPKIHTPIDSLPTEARALTPSPFFESTGRCKYRGYFG